MISVINNVIAGGCFESVLFFASVFSSVLPFLQCIAVYSVYSPVYYLSTGTRITCYVMILKSAMENRMNSSVKLQRMINSVLPLPKTGKEAG